VGVGELAEQFFCKKADGRAHVEAEIVVLVFNLAGNLDEAVVRVDEHLHREVRCWSTRISLPIMSYFKGVQQDTSTYYLLGYHSTNLARDGRYRRITVKVNLPGLKIDYRRGYYAPADYQHSTKEDKELQLEQELASELPVTDRRVEEPDERR
jgi:hypothetical protein